MGSGRYVHVWNGLCHHFRFRYVHPLSVCTVVNLASLAVKTTTSSIKAFNTIDLTGRQTDTPTGMKTLPKLHQIFKCYYQASVKLSVSYTSEENLVEPEVKTLEAELQREKLIDATPELSVLLSPIWPVGLCTPLLSSHYYSSLIMVYQLQVKASSLRNLNNRKYVGSYSYGCLWHAFFLYCATPFPFRGYLRAAWSVCLIPAISSFL